MHGYCVRIPVSLRSRVIVIFPERDSINSTNKSLVKVVAWSSEVDDDIVNYVQKCPQYNLSSANHLQIVQLSDLNPLS